MEIIDQVKSGRAALAAEVVGSGSPVVFLHAGVADRRMWRAQQTAVGATHKAIAYDRRGFGATRAAAEDFSAVTDLAAVIDTLADGVPAILVGCSQGGRIAIDAALRRPSLVRALVLVAPALSGAPEPAFPPEIEKLLALLEEAEQAGDLDRVNAIEAHLWLDGPLETEGRVVGQPRRLFLDMNAIALRSPQIGSDLDAESAFDRLGEISAPTLVIWGDLDFPHIQERCRHVALGLAKASHHILTGVAHLPSLERPSDVASLIVSFINRDAIQPDGQSWG